MANIIGISAFFHDAACCLLQNGVLVAAAEEERFSRIKADPAVPAQALRYCLQKAGLQITDIDCIAYYEQPQKKLSRQLWSGIFNGTWDLLGKLQPDFVERQFREILGFEKEIRCYDHHMSHAASSFYFSGFREAAILTVDGVGEWDTTTYGIGSSEGISLFESVAFPDSLGLLYSTITSYLGFGVNDGEYKVMGLAPYGQPRYIDLIRQLIQVTENGQYRLDMKYFDFLSGNTMFSPALEGLLGKGRRGEDEPILQFHQDIAKSLQVVLEEILIEKAGYLHHKTGQENLCMAGGVALNCVANGQVLRKGPFKKLFVQPASNDAGGCLGAAALAHVDITGNRPDESKMKHVYLGPSYDPDQVARILEGTSLRYTDYRNNTSRLLTETAKRIREGMVMGWFQGGMEFGPRSLGARSILADPRNPHMRDRINAMVKKREGFRPFAPAVLADKAGQHFKMDHLSPFMLETCQVISSLDLPAITHVDGSARVQTVEKNVNPKFYGLIKAFDEITGCPIVLNTSFNIKGEPIVCTPEDAIRCFITTNIDCLVLEEFIIDRSEQSLDLLQLILFHDIHQPDGISHDVYTFA